MKGSTSVRSYPGRKVVFMSWLPTTNCRLGKFILLTAISTTCLPLFKKSSGSKCPRDFNKGACIGTHYISDAGLTPYDGADMPRSINSSSPVAQQRAIGQLIYHAGISVQSDYESDGTGADPEVISAAFRNFFGFTCGPLE